MNFTILSPLDNPVQNSQSDITDSDFGGNRQVTGNISETHDYTKSRGGASEIQENPVDETKKDIDDAEVELKLRFQQSNEADFIIKSDKENLPLEDTDPVIEPSTELPKRHRKSNPWNLNAKSVYEGEIS